MKKLFAAVFLLLASQLASAHPVKAGDLTIDGVWARSTAAQAANGAAYLTISNHGASSDKLISVSTAVADQAQLHHTSMDNGVMRMREVEGGVEIAAGKTVKFAPGGFHIMLMGLKKPLKQGEHFAITLHFARAGEVKLNVAVRDMAAGHEMHGDMHDGMKMD
ncbi:MULTISPECIES: copper chaperone PCu(A)C [unclassified Paludibacterium]|uniref:copper chaperone PCu(A)C n=1 Tax=unclassified Paludibacterium TaxID=2618429 RepID=UPI001C053446|nr:copper chaperone PCu(A)C [Paludibacterium sp. B53371]BEV72525.1 copper chaperone PCu(A)C [Paludibacterium sp. THUN1379]